MFSALHLTDGALTVEATEALSLKACTVVLSACETALAEQGNGDEMVGLVRAFLVAGAARVLASLWPVDDEITSRFMAHFHGALCEGVTPAASLRLAQAEVMRAAPPSVLLGGFYPTRALVAPTGGVAPGHWAIPPRSLRGPRSPTERPAGHFACRSLIAKGECDSWRRSCVSRRCSNVARLCCPFKRKIHEALR